MSASACLAAMGSAQSVVAPIAPREFRGQMCGIRLPGAPPVDGGAPDAALILSWFVSRYPLDWRERIMAEYLRDDYPDVLTSWTDDRAVGLSPADHVERLQELCAKNLRPAEMLSSKLYCPQNDAAGTMQIINEVLPLLVKADCVSRYCVGFEMNLWNTYESLQGIIDGVAAQVVPKRPLSVHFSPGYADWRPDRPGSTFADFWNPQVGKLSSLWHQAVPEWTDQEYQERLGDVLARFAGNFNVSPTSGFGHPFDCSAVEITAQPQFNGDMTEAQGNARAMVALTTPAAYGPAGKVIVMGSGNGQVR
jgi:hypothetical protein